MSNSLQARRSSFEDPEPRRSYQPETLFTHPRGEGDPIKHVVTVQESGSRENPITLPETPLFPPPRPSPGTASHETHTASRTERHNQSRPVNQNLQITTLRNGLPALGNPPPRIPSIHLPLSLPLPPNLTQLPPFLYPHLPPFDSPVHAAPRPRPVEPRVNIFPSPILHRQLPPSQRTPARPRTYHVHPPYEPAAEAELFLHSVIPAPYRHYDRGPLQPRFEQPLQVATRDYIEDLEEVARRALNGERISWLNQYPDGRDMGYMRDEAEFRARMGALKRGRRE